MSNFTIERRQFILGAVLVPFASQFAAARVKPRSMYAEFVIRLQGCGSKFNIYITEDGDVEQVTYGVRDETFQMNAMPLAAMGDLRGRCWRTYKCENGPHKASIRFMVDGPTMVQIDWLMATEQLT